MISQKTQTVAFALLFCAFVAAAAGALHISNVQDEITALEQPVGATPTEACADLETAPVGEPQLDDSYTGVPSEAVGS